MPRVRNAARAADRADGAQARRCCEIARCRRSRTMASWPASAAFGTLGIDEDAMGGHFHRGPLEYVQAEKCSRRFLDFRLCQFPAGQGIEDVQSFLRKL